MKSISVSSRGFPATTCLWFGLYLGMLGAITCGLRTYRAWATREFASMEAAEDWQKWRSDAAKLNERGPVTRRAPMSTEPPALVLMRDHFAACLGISLLLSSMLFLTFMVAIRGALRQPAAEPDGTGT